MRDVGKVRLWCRHEDIVIDQPAVPVLTRRALIIAQRRKRAFDQRRCGVRDLGSFALVIEIAHLIKGR